MRQGGKGRGRNGEKLREEGEQRVEISEREIDLVNN